MATTIVSFDRAALLLKLEGTYGTDPVPVGATDSILISNGRIRFSANKLVRELDRAYFGGRPFILTGRQAFVEFDIELMGAAAAGGSSPNWPVLRATGHAETLVAVTSAAYNPVSVGFESVTAYFFIPSADASGARRHVISGIHGTITFNQSINNYGRGRVVLTGQEAVMTDNAFPAQTLTAFQDPVAITNGTWSVTVDPAGAAPLFAVDCVELELAQGGRVQLYETSEQQRVAITARDTQGFMRIMSPALADVDFFALSAAHTRVNIQSVVTGGAGKNTTLSIGTAQLEYPELIDIDGAAGLRVPFSAIPTDAGNDEYQLIHT
ncbi:MAG: hypothetical protein ACSLE2_10850 [Lysobacterales bacterium]